MGSAPYDGERSRFTGDIRSVDPYATAAAAMRRERLVSVHRSACSCPCAWSASCCERVARGRRDRRQPRPQRPAHGDHGGPRRTPGHPRRPRCPRTDDGAGFGVGVECRSHCQSCEHHAVQSSRFRRYALDTTQSTADFSAVLTGVSSQLSVLPPSRKRFRLAPAALQVGTPDHGELHELLATPTDAPAFRAEQVARGYGRGARALTKAGAGVAR